LLDAQVKEGWQTKQITATFIRRAIAILDLFKVRLGPTNLKYMFIFKRTDTYVFSINTAYNQEYYLYYCCCKDFHICYICKYISVSITTLFCIT